MRVLIVYTSISAQTKAVADALADTLARAGLVVELADADAVSPPSPTGYEAVVIGSSTRFGRHPASVIEYISRSLDVLIAMPAFFFVVGIDEDIARMCDATGWRPRRSAAFPHLSPNRGRFLRRLSHRPTATALDSPRVRAFGVAIADGLAALRACHEAHPEMWS